MARIQHSTEVDDLGKSFIPEGQRLATDRSKQAKTVYDDPKKWREHGTGRSDLKGFDTKSAREPKKASLIKQALGIRGKTTSAEDAILTEPNRFLKYYHEQLSKQELGKIVDFQSFLKATKKVFGDDSSLNNMKEEIGDGEIGYRQIFNTEQVQSIIRKNTEDLVIPFLMQRNNIERQRATSVWQSLSPVQKNKVISKFMRTKKVRIRKSTVIPTLVQGKVKLIKQVSASGRIYQRRKPMQWTDMQETFIKNNKKKGIVWIETFYNKIFPDSRTKSSISNKMYRIKK